MTDPGDLLDHLRRAGDHDSVGAFTVDRAAMRRKMARYQDLAPGMWAVLAVRVAVGSGATSIEFSRSMAEVRFDGLPLELPQVRAALDGVSGADVRSLDLARLGHHLLDDGAARVSIESRRGADSWRMVVGGGVDTFELEEASRTTRIRIDGTLDGAAARAALQRWCTAPPLELKVPGGQGRSRCSAPLVARRLTGDGPTGCRIDVEAPLSLQTSPSPLCGVLAWGATPANAPAQCAVVLGQSLDISKHLGLPGITRFVADDRLSTDLSLTHVRDDAVLREVVSAVQAEVWSMAADAAVSADLLSAQTSRVQALLQLATRLPGASPTVINLMWTLARALRLPDIFDGFERIEDVVTVARERSLLDEALRERITRAAHVLGELAAKAEGCTARGLRMALLARRSLSERLGVATWRDDAALAVLAALQGDAPTAREALERAARVTDATRPLARLVIRATAADDEERLQAFERGSTPVEDADRIFVQEGPLEQVASLEGDDVALLDSKVDALWLLGREREAAELADGLLAGASGRLDDRARRAVVEALRRPPHALLHTLRGWRAAVFDRGGQPPTDLGCSGEDSDLAREAMAALEAPSLLTQDSRLNALQQRLVEGGGAHRRLMREILWVRVRILRHQRRFAEADRAQACRHLSAGLPALLAAQGHPAG